MLNRLSDKIGAILRRTNPSKIEVAAGMENGRFRPFSAEYSVAPSHFRVIQDRYRLMEVEREILSHAIRRLYEAEVNGRISKSELKILLGRYKKRLANVKGTIQHDQSLVALYNLEHIRAELVELFNKHFDDLNEKIGEVKARFDSSQVTNHLSEQEKSTQRKDRAHKSKKPASTKKKSQVDQKIEQIRTMIEETQKRLSKIEIET